MMTNDDFNTASRVNRATAMAAAAKDGIDAAGAGANRAFDAAFDKLGEVRDKTAPVLRQRIDQARTWVGETAGRVQDGAQAARDKASDLTDHVVDYTREEPVKALLIAAAIGGGLIGLLAMLTRSND